MVLTRELEGRDREGQEQKRIELKEKLNQLQMMAREAKGRGEMDKAERLGAEAEELERILKTEFQQREKAGHVKELQAKLVEIKKAAQLAQQQGREDEAAELREKAKQIAREIEEPTPPGNIRSPKNEIERLHALAAEAKERGQHDQADALLREAKELESRPKGPPELKKQPPVPPELLHQIELLRDEVMRLRKDVEELRQLVHRER
jgi:tetratricopeptide (TPR) repeat protein